MSLPKLLEEYLDIDKFKSLFYTFFKADDENNLTIWRQFSVWSHSLYNRMTANHVATGVVTFGVGGIGAIIYIAADIKRHKDKLNLRDFTYHQNRLAEANRLVTSIEFAEQVKVFATIKMEDILKNLSDDLYGIEKEKVINEKLQEILNQWLNNKFPGKNLQVYRNKTYVLPSERGVYPYEKIQDRLQNISDRLFGVQKYEVKFEKDARGKRKFSFKNTTAGKDDFLREKRMQQQVIAQLPWWIRFFRFTTINEIIGTDTPTEDLEKFNAYSGARLFYKKPQNERYSLNKFEQVGLAISENPVMMRGASPALASLGIMAFMYWIIWMSYLNMHGTAIGFATFTLTLSTGFIFFGIPLAMGFLFLLGYVIWHLTNSPERELNAQKNNHQQLLLQYYFIEERAAYFKDKLEGFSNPNSEDILFEENQKYPGLTRFRKIAELVDETDFERIKNLLETDFISSDEFEVNFIKLYTYDPTNPVNIQKFYTDLINKNIIQVRFSQRTNLEDYIDKQIEKSSTMLRNRFLRLGSRASEKSIQYLQKKLGIDRELAIKLLTQKQISSDLKREAVNKFTTNLNNHETALAKRQFEQAAERVLLCTKTLARNNVTREAIIKSNELIKNRLLAENKIATYIGRKLSKNELANTEDLQQKIQALIAKIKNDNASNDELINKIGLTSAEVESFNTINDGLFNELNDGIFAIFDKKIKEQKSTFQTLKQEFDSSKRKAEPSIFTKWFSRLFPIEEAQPSPNNAPDFIRRLRGDKYGIVPTLRGGLFGGFASFMEVGFVGWIVTDFLFYICGVAGAVLSGATIATPIIFGLVIGLTVLFTVYAAIKASQTHKNTLKRLDALEEELSAQEKVHNFVELNELIEKVKNLKVTVNHLRSDIDLLLIEKCRNENGTINFPQYYALRELYNPKIEFPDFTNDHFYRLMRTDESNWGMVRKFLWRFSSFVDGAGGGSYMGRFFLLPMMGCTVFVLAITHPHIAALIIIGCVVTIAAMKIWKMCVERERNRDELIVNEMKVRVKGLEEQESLLLMHQAKLQEQFVTLMRKENMTAAMNPDNNNNLQTDNSTVGKNNFTQGEERQDLKDQALPAGFSWKKPNTDESAESSPELMAELCKRSSIYEFPTSDSCSEPPKNLIEQQLVMGGPE